MAQKVTGEQYMAIHGKILEIIRQLRQKGGYPFDLNELNMHLQMAIEGFFVGPFKIWKTIRMNRELEVVGDFLTAFTYNGLTFENSVQNFLEKSNFEIVPSMTDVDLVRVSASDLGLDEKATTSEIFGKAQKFGLSLCPNEIAPQLRLQYLDQPKGELLRIAMKPVVVGERKLLFCIYKTLDGAIMLGSVSGDSYARWNPKHEWIFMLQKRDQVS